MSKINYQKVIESPLEKKLYKRLTQNILDFLGVSGRGTFWQIVRFVGGSDRRTLRLVNQMVKAGLIQYKQGYFITITPPNHKVHRLSPPHLTLCPSCKGRVVVLPKSLESIRKTMEKIYKYRPQPTFVFDQRPVTLNTTLNRLAYMIYRRDLQGKRIAVIGDDDLTSLAITLSGAAKQVTVFDIDKRLVKFLEEQKVRLDLNLEIVYRDLAYGIPSKYANKFDVFLTDPTPTLIPFTLFLNIGLKLLKQKAGGIGYVSLYSTAMESSLALQKTITEMKLLITDVIPCFTEYEFIKATYSNADLALLRRYELKRDRLSFTESLLRFETTSHSMPQRMKFRLEDMLGSATNRVLVNPNCDPAFKYGKDRKYLKEVLQRLLQDKERMVKI